MLQCQYLHDLQAPCLSHDVLTEHSSPLPWPISAILCYVQFSLQPLQVPDRKNSLSLSLTHIHTHMRMHMLTQPPLVTMVTQETSVVAWQLG
jgi:hypothetical protein